MTTLNIEQLVNILYINNDVVGMVDNDSDIIPLIVMGIYDI